jgi:hypothetical protein
MFSFTRRGGRAEILGMSSLTYGKRRRILIKRTKRIEGMVKKVPTEKEGEERLVILLRRNSIQNSSVKLHFRGMGGYM